MKKSTKVENWVQAEALRRMKGSVLDSIDLYASDFRQIISDYQAQYNGRLPSADDLIWIVSERRGRDITKQG